MGRVGSEIYNNHQKFFISGLKDLIFPLRAACWLSNILSCKLVVCVTSILLSCSCSLSCHHVVMSFNESYCIYLVKLFYSFNHMNKRKMYSAIYKQTKYFSLKRSDCTSQNSAYFNCTDTQLSENGLLLFFWKPLWGKK